MSLTNSFPSYKIGTAGWSYKDWIGSFYPQPQSLKFDWLQFYAQYFNCVEVNSTYYTYLSSAIVNGWIKKIENINDFIFTIKLHQDFTHHSWQQSNQKKFTKDNIKSVQDSLDILLRAERFGGLLIQFPYSFSFSEPSMQYIQQLNEIFQSYVQFVEVRHSSWNNKSAYEFFNSLNITFCTIDQPQIGQSIPFEPIITSDKLYIRFHGRNTEAWKKSLKNFGKEQSYEQQSERYKYLYSPGELSEISQKIKELYDKVKQVYIIMNNHPQGDAIANAFELMSTLDNQTKIKMPETTLNKYLRLKQFVDLNFSDGSDLFNSRD